MIEKTNLLFLFSTILVFDVNVCTFSVFIINFFFIYTLFKFQAKFAVDILSVKVDANPEYLTFTSNLKDDGGMKVVDMSIDLIKDIGNEGYVNLIKI